MTFNKGYENALNLTRERESKKRAYIDKIKADHNIVTKQANGVYLAASSDIDLSTPEIKDITDAFKTRSKDPLHCLRIGYENNQKVSWMDTIMTENSFVVQSQHCVNYGRGLLIDMSDDADLFGGDILVLRVNGTTLKDYLDLAEIIFPGEWKYFGNEGYEEIMRIQEESIAKALAKYPEMNE